MRRLDSHDPAARTSPVQLAAAAARRGELVVLPTEHAYVVACDAFAPGAPARLERARGGPARGAVPVMVASVRGFDAMAATVTLEEKRLATAFWPGSLTLLVRPQPSLQWDLAAERSVAVRMPLHPVALEVLHAVGPMVVIAANRLGQPVPLDCDAAVEQLGEDVSVYLDAGPRPAGPPSTIVDLTGPDAVVVREGAVAVVDLASVLPELAPSVGDEAPAVDTSGDAPSEDADA